MVFFIEINSFFQDGVNRGNIHHALATLLETIIAVKVAVQGNLDLGNDIWAAL